MLETPERKCQVACRLFILLPKTVGERLHVALEGVYCDIKLDSSSAKTCKVRNIPGAKSD